MLHSSYEGMWREGMMCGRGVFNWAGKVKHFQPMRLVAFLNLCSCALDQMGGKKKYLS